MALYSKIATILPSSSMAKALAMSTSTQIQTPLIGPAAKLLLFHYNLEANSIPNHSGPKKNLLKSDILRHIKNGKLTPAKREQIMNLKNESKISGNQEMAKLPKSKTTTKPKKYVDIPLTNMRQVIAKRLISQSKTNIPHAYISASISSGKIQQLREKFAKNYDLKLSLNDFIIKACAQTLRNFPQINVQWKGDRLEQIPHVDISVAVATPNGLITPILFGADGMSLEQISRKLRELAGRAREGKLRPEEFQGGTFTISNLGMFGSVSNFTAIINPPQAAILAVGGLSADTAAAADGHFQVTLCFDARAIQEGDAVKFIQNLQFSLAEPNGLLAGMEMMFMGGEVEDEQTLDLEEEQLDLATLEMENEIDMKNNDDFANSTNSDPLAKFLL